MARAWDDGDKEAVRAEVLEAPAASEEDSAADRVEVSEVPAVLVEYSAMARAGGLEVPEVSEKDSVEDRVEVSEVPAVSGGDSVVALVLVPAVSGGDRVMVPAFVAYKRTAWKTGWRAWLWLRLWRLRRRCRLMLMTAEGIQHRVYIFPAVLQMDDLAV